MARILFLMACVLPGYWENSAGFFVPPKIKGDCSPGLQAAFSTLPPPLARGHLPTLTRCKSRPWPRLRITTKQCAFGCGLPGSSPKPSPSAPTPCGAPVMRGEGTSPPSERREGALPRWPRPHVSSPFPLPSVNPPHHHVAKNQAPGLF